MGVWDWMYSATDAVKRNAPDVTPVTKACRKGYEVSRAATVQVDGAVRIKAREIHEHLSNDQFQENMSRVAKSISKNGALYLARSYGAGPVIDVVSRAMQENNTDSQKERIQALETKVAKLEKELSSRKILEQAEIPQASISMASKAQGEPGFNANIKQKPEDVLRIFMMKQFVGTKFLDDLIIPGKLGSLSLPQPDYAQNFGLTPSLMLHSQRK